MIQLRELENLYNTIKKIKPKKEYGGFNKYESFELNIVYNKKLLDELIELNIVKDYKNGLSDINGFLDISNYIILDINKIKFIISYENKVNDGGIKKVRGYLSEDIEKIIEEIKSIGFEKVYRTISLDGKYKIKEIIYFVHYIFYLGNKEIIEILENYVNKYSNNVDSNKIILNELNGEVMKDGKIVGELKINTLPFKFFKYLLDNKGEVRTHLEIMENINPGFKPCNGKGLYLSDIKRGLPEGIKKIIKSQKLHYLIP